MELYFQLFYLFILQNIQQQWIYLNSYMVGEMAWVDDEAWVGNRAWIGDGAWVGNGAWIGVG